MEENHRIPLQLRIQRALPRSTQQLLGIRYAESCSEGKLQHLVPRRAAGAVKKLMPVGPLDLRLVNHLCRRQIFLEAQLFQQPAEIRNLHLILIVFEVQIQIVCPEKLPQHGVRIDFISHSHPSRSKFACFQYSESCWKKQAEKHGARLRPGLPVIPEVSADRHLQIPLFLGIL